MGRPVWAIVGLSLMGVAWSVVQVLSESGATSDHKGPGRAGKATEKWEWIDVVRRQRSMTGIVHCAEPRVQKLTEWKC